MCSGCFLPGVVVHVMSCYSFTSSFWPSDLLVISRRCIGITAAAVGSMQEEYQDLLLRIEEMDTNSFIGTTTTAVTAAVRIIGQIGSQFFIGHQSSSSCFEGAGRQNWVASIAKVVSTQMAFGRPRSSTATASQLDTDSSGSQWRASLGTGSALLPLLLCTCSAADLDSWEQWTCYQGRGLYYWMIALDPLFQIWRSLSSLPRSLKTRESQCYFQSILSAIQISSASGHSKFSGLG